MRIDRVISHRDFVDNHSFLHDISLIHVDEDIVFNDYVRPLCLSVGEVPFGMKCIVAGWGDTECK